MQWYLYIVASGSALFYSYHLFGSFRAFTKCKKTKLNRTNPFQSLWTWHKPYAEQVAFSTVEELWSYLSLFMFKILWGSMSSGLTHKIKTGIWLVVDRLCLTVSAAFLHWIQLLNSVQICADRQREIMQSITVQLAPVSSRSTNISLLLKRRDFSWLEMIWVRQKMSRFSQQV